MTKNTARKGTPKPRNINLAAIKRAVTETLADSPAAITTLEQVVEQALLVASGEGRPRPQGVRRGQRFESRSLRYYPSWPKKMEWSATRLSAASSPASAERYSQEEVMFS